jgi:3-methyladenine DNA glycosylase AlkC
MEQKSLDKGTGFSLKDHLFNETKVCYLADLFQKNVAGFNARVFIRETMTGLAELELKARIVHIATKLEQHLSDDFAVASKQIVSALPPPLDPNRTDDDFGDFIIAPLGEYVVRNGLTKKHLRHSLKTLQEITQRFSMEDAIRAFINAFPAETMDELTKWAAHKNYHVRRLVSEGTRPSLPWSGRIAIDPKIPLGLLDRLYSDSTRYVTRSVANHLNDIAKAQPETVLQTLKRWKKENAQHKAEFEWICKHALRTLVKKGHAQALEFLGFTSNPQVIISDFKLATKKVKPGEAIEFSFTVAANQPESVVIDYVIEFVKANGALSPKVHKLKQLQLEQGTRNKITKRHVLRANATTYTLYPGTHFVTLQVNGKSFGRKSFELTAF